MSTQPHALVSWPEFQRLPERPEEGRRYELHDGEVVIAPPSRPLHIKIQKRVERILEGLAGDRGVVAVEFPYRPAPNLQYWIADVAYVPKAEWSALPPDDYPVYAPPLIVEVLSPSNTPLKLNRQRTIALSAGTHAFWVIDPAARTVEVTTLQGAVTYRFGESFGVGLLGGTLAVRDIFEI